MYKKSWHFAACCVYSDTERYLDPVENGYMKYCHVVVSIKCNCVPCGNFVLRCAWCLFVCLVFTLFAPSSLAESVCFRCNPNACLLFSYSCSQAFHRHFHNFFFLRSPLCSCPYSAHKKSMEIVFCFTVSSLPFQPRPRRSPIVFIRLDFHKSANSHPTRTHIPYQSIDIPKAN